MVGWDGWASLGGQLDGGVVAVGNNADGRLEVFGSILGSSGPELGHVWQTAPNGAWSGWASFGSPPTSFLGFPSVGNNADQRLEAFVRVGLMSTGSLWHIWQTAPNNGWSSWNNLDGGLGAHFTLVAANVDGRLEAFGISPLGHVIHIWQTVPNGSWSGWSDLGTPPGIGITQPSVGRNQDGRLELVATGSDQALWQIWQTATGGGWSSWASLGQPSGVGVGLPAVGSNQDGRLEVFALGSDQALWHIWQTAPNGGWAGWASLGAPSGPANYTLMQPTVARNADGRLEVFVVRYGDGLYHIYQTAPNGGWNGWDALGGDPDAVIAVGTNADGRLEIFAEARATEGPREAWHRWQTTPSNGWFSSTAQWEQASLAGPAQKIFTPAGGAVLVRTNSGLFRSDDNGSSWTGVSLPAAPGVVGVDPVNVNVIFAAGSGAVYKSTNGGASWSSLLSTGADTVLAIAVSPANSNVVYVALGGDEFTLRRTTDGGGTWTTLEGPEIGDLCFWTVNILQGHATNAMRAFRSSGCYAGRNVPTGDALKQSTDEGATWNDVFHAMGQFPDKLCGGSGAGSQRYYVATYVGGPPGGGTVYRSDDDGATWAQVLNETSGPQVRGLACHASLPDRVYAGLTSGVVQASADGGASWNQLAQDGLGGVADLALNRGETALFAATTSGVWRIWV